MYGSLNKGYPKDYSDALTLLFRDGICPHTVFKIPENADTYPLLILSGVARMTDKEKLAVQSYMQAGGKVIAVGPTAFENCENTWKLPTRVNVPREAFFTTVLPGESWIKPPEWINWDVESSHDPDRWSQPLEGFWYHPQRISEKANNEKVLELCRRYMKPMPVAVTRSQGYLCTMFEAEDQLTVHFLAEEYDVDIDHKLDSIRFHRSRVNLVTKAEPIGIDGILCFETDKAPAVYTPFNPEASAVEFDGKVCTVTLPEKCPYAILQFRT